MCYGMNCPRENRYSGECGLFPPPCLEEDDRDFPDSGPEDEEKENAA